MVVCYGVVYVADLLFIQRMQIFSTMVRIKFELISNLCSGLSFMSAAVVL